VSVFPLVSIIVVRLGDQKMLKNDPARRIEYHLV